MHELFIKKTVIGVAILLFSYAAVFAQGTSSDSFYPQFAADPDPDMAYAEQPVNFFTKGIQYGGWVTPSVIMHSTGGADTLLSVNVFRLWARVYLWNDAFLYVRGKDTLTAPIDYPGLDTDNIIDLDLGYIDMLFWKKRMQIGIGRKYFFLGTGFVLNGRGDGADIRLNTGLIDARAFVSYTGLLNKDDNPYNLSSADYSDGAKRLFAGLSLSKDIINHNVYLFGLTQTDFGGGSKDEYNSMYWGLGAKGFLLGRMGYYGEFILETGESYTTGRGEKKDILACAVNAGLDYRLNTVTAPALFLQYAFGSGDADRRSTFLSNGDVSGKDTNFITFGTFNGGYGLNPYVGNLHTIRAGFSLNPFETVPSKFFNRMSLIAKYSLYLKDKLKGNINAMEAAKKNRLVGNGLDVSLRWRILSDLSFFTTYGLFLPGSAFPSGEDNRHFLVCGLNLAF